MANGDGSRGDKPDRIVDDVDAWLSGHQWGILLFGYPIPGTRAYHPTRLTFGNLGTDKSSRAMTVEPHTVDFHYESIETGTLIEGTSLDRNDIIAWFADGGIDIDPQRVTDEAAFVAKVIRAAANGTVYRHAANDPLVIHRLPFYVDNYPSQPLLIPLVAVGVLVGMSVWGWRKIQAAFHGGRRQS